MMQREDKITREDAARRPAGARIESIEGRWTLQVLLCLNRGEPRFADLKAALPRITSNILTDRIRSLENAGLIERRYLPPPAARHVYGLAPRANGLRPALDALTSWRAEEEYA